MILESSDLRDPFAFSKQKKKDGGGEIKKKLERSASSKAEEKEAGAVCGWAGDGASDQEALSRKIMTVLSQVENRNDDGNGRYEITGIKGRVKSLDLTGHRWNRNITARINSAPFFPALATPSVLAKPLSMSPVFLSFREPSAHPVITPYPVEINRRFAIR